MGESIEKRQKPADGNALLARELFHGIGLRDLCLLKSGSEREREIDTGRCCFEKGEVWSNHPPMY